ncbi:MAG: HipA domain-containing protein, partial [Janthinobacterium lividum]
MDCHLQIFHHNAWRDCACVSVPRPALGGVGATAWMEYDLDYAFEVGAAAVSLVYPVNASHHVLDQWPAFMYDLLPQGNGRKYLLGQLGLGDGPGADLALICAGAFNPIGNVRVREAVAYFNAHVLRHGGQTMKTGMTMNTLLARGDEFLERMTAHGMLATGTTSVQGA